MARVCDQRLPFWGVAFTAMVVMGAPPSEGRELRVCADPNNLPFSNQRLEGFENKVAQLLAEEMDATMQYNWLPQRRGFVRRSLKAGLCDLVLGVPSGYEPVLATAPYYHSSYAFVYRRDRNLELRSFDDPVLRTLKIGLHAIGDDGANPPPAHALARRGIVGNVVGYSMWDVDGVESPPGRIVDAVAAGDIDVAIIWGPFAGYFAQRQPVELEVVPVSPALDPPALPFVYAISMGVRQGEDGFKQELDGIIERRRADIANILRDYGVPFVDAAPTVTTE